ncbi:ABC-F type ribosomal protection protein [Jeotgalibacillus sp. S-D1]|uniref:Vga family ABC-F type ribosomal protection protein n=1 Tax=Jeotgalibacillus sp. S-D1 TaxID=2552189 RepID=UPI0010596E74|nr:ABC-F type ribosomal protection protein [Jeotgalibacillus sp. S-D1]TDL31426.1 ABC-F type ribosomal protection protein [Jeotgalibacillus sp. S-D1]
MLLLEGNQVKKSVRDRLLFQAEQLRIYRGDRIGLVGKNGTGKTTLLSILAGNLKPDEGMINTHSSRHLLPQLKRTDTTRSGGEVTQDYINKALALKAEILFADEPTTNLDTQKMDALEQQFKRFQGAIVLVSHDRAFLDQICTKIWEIEESKVKEYKGNYSSYAQQKELEKRQHEEAYDQFVKKKRQLEEAVRLKEQKAERATKAPKNGSELSKFSSPYFAKKQKKLQKTASAMETKIEQLEEVEKPKNLSVVKMSLPNEDAIMNRTVVTIEQQVLKTGNKELFKTPYFKIRGGEKIALIGHNGSGKTTFLREIMNGSPKSTVSPSCKIGYFSQNLDILHPEKSIYDNVQETSYHKEELIRTVLARLHFYKDDVYKKVNILSGGERVKVAFAKVFLSELNMLVMDEPTNFLDIEAVEALEQLLIDFKGTVLFVSHDRRLIEHVAGRIIEIKDKSMKVFDGNWKEFREYEPKKERDGKEDELLLLNTKITEVLSKLSFEPSAALDEEFQQLLEQKKRIQR